MGNVVKGITGGAKLPKVDNTAAIQEQNRIIELERQNAELRKKQEEDELAFRSRGLFNLLGGGTLTGYKDSDKGTVLGGGG